MISHNYNFFIFEKDSKNRDWKNRIFKKWSDENCVLQCKIKAHIFHLMQKSNSKWMEDFNMKPVTFKLPEESRQCLMGNRLEHSF